MILICHFWYWWLDILPIRYSTIVIFVYAGAGVVSISVAIYCKIRCSVLLSWRWIFIRSTCLIVRALGYILELLFVGLKVCLGWCSIILWCCRSATCNGVADGGGRGVIAIIVFWWVGGGFGVELLKGSVLVSWVVIVVLVDGLGRVLFVGIGVGIILLFGPARLGPERLGQHQD